ncbi:TPA: phage protein NinX family protein [Salmonella enterica subsp. enterica serovar Typhimurium]|uniref:DUF2591 domain-containing protein n=2 Tax=Salmonella enterica TaxID=28901 RepID=A0A741C115_SALTM|nr:DUF2591 domain-containing protein [Salmonella enterica subsp. enterica serovar Typhimurium]HAF9921133.1 DUF2591 domain-containing protein [Salmonella enterica]
MDYRKISDFEINVNVAYKLYAMGVVNKVLIPDTPNKISGVQLMHEGEWRWFDPCNNPADAWPIIEKQGISIKHVVVNCHEQTWRASFAPDYVKHKYTDKNPLRAAMVVFLMLQNI